MLFCNVSVRKANITNRDAEDEVLTANPSNGSLCVSFEVNSIWILLLSVSLEGDSGTATRRLSCLLPEIWYTNFIPLSLPYLHCHWIACLYFLVVIFFFDKKAIVKKITAHGTSRNSSLPASPIFLYIFVGSFGK